MILIKRYGVPFAVTVVLYSIIYLIFGAGCRYLGMGLVLSVLSAYLIRICDDIGDYKKDRTCGKAPIRKGILIAMCAFDVSVWLFLSLISKEYLMLIPPTLILSQFFIKDKYRDVIKPLFMPTVIVTLVLSFFTFNPWLYVIVPILIISDVILIVYKRRRRSI